MKEFKDVQVGDWIFTIRAGWTKVTKIQDVTCPIHTEYTTYSMEGKYYHSDVHPAAWTYDPLNGTEHPTSWEDVEVGTAVKVRNYVTDVWALGKIIVYDADKELPYGCLGYGERLQKEIVYFKYAKLAK